MAYINTPNLVGYEEALRLSQFSSVNNFTYVKELADEFIKSPKAAYALEGGFYWFNICLWNTVYCAGRLQGIREERQKRRAHEEKAQ